MKHSPIRRREPAQRSDLGLDIEEALILPKRGRSALRSWAAGPMLRESLPTPDFPRRCRMLYVHY